MRRSALVLALSLLACAGRREPEVTTKSATPIEVAPQLIAALPEELAPILCGPEGDDLPAACEAMASHPQQFQLGVDRSRRPKIA